LRWVENCIRAGGEVEIDADHNIGHDAWHAGYQLRQVS
jgi:hypothetical protein